MSTLISTPVKSSKPISLNFIKTINSRIEKEKNNAIGLSVAFVMIGTGVASLTAALAVHGEVSIVILMTATILAMATNAAVISQQPLQRIVWFFMVNILVNVILLGYQIIQLMI